MDELPHLQQEVKRLRAAIDELTVLNDLAIAASSSLEVEEVLNIIIQKSIKAVKAEQGSISLVTPESEKPLKTLIRHVDKTDQFSTYRVGMHITGWVLKYKKPLIIKNLADDERFHATKEEEDQIHSVLCVPISSRAKVIGILMMINKKAGESLTEDDLRLLSIIAAQSGQLIRNSQLQQEAIEKKRMAQELAVARRIQLGLIPDKDPELFRKYVDIGTYFNPAEEVGGDYFDYVVLDNNRMGVVIADVSGHGPPAAMIMTMVKGIIKSLTHDFSGPDESLSQINAILISTIPRQIFITMMFLVFDFDKKIILMSNAGHNPLIHFSHEKGGCNKIHIKGCALNLSNKSVYTVVEIPFNPNDLFFIYTDGVTEATNAEMDMFDEERLIQNICQKASNPVSDLIDHLKTKVSTFTGDRPQADDILMLGVKIKE
jgi:sigma-B regulation protein RsbU (phosphoserine phosphatase)